MEITIKRTRYEEGEGFWDVGFSITTSTGLSGYAPTTIYVQELPANPKESDIMREAAKKTIPQHIALLYEASNNV